MEDFFDYDCLADEGPLCFDDAAFLLGIAFCAAFAERADDGTGVRFGATRRRGRIARRSVTGVSFMRVTASRHVAARSGDTIATRRGARSP